MFSQWGKTSVQNFSNLFLKILAEGAVTTEAGSLFQYFTNIPASVNVYKKRLEKVVYYLNLFLESLFISEASEIFPPPCPYPFEFFLGSVVPF